MKKKDKISNIMDVYYCVIHYFVEGCQNDNFHLRSGAKLEVGSIIILFLHRDW